MITQRDIARRVGVSTSLVSRALGGTAPRIGAAAATIARIRTEAARLGYEPSAAALMLRGASTGVLGVIVKDFGDPFFGQMLGELQRLAWTKRYSLLVTGGAPGQPEQSDLTSLRKYQLDGLIVLGSFFAPAGLETFRTGGIPVVQIGCGESDPGARRVAMDEEYGLAQLARYLQELGHCEIGYVGTDAPANVRREQILCAACERIGLTARAAAVVRVAAGDWDAGERAIEEMQRRCGRELPTAIVAADDLLAQTAVRRLCATGLRVPADISVAGVDDIPFACMTRPALTTLRQPIRELVQHAFRWLTEPDEPAAAAGSRAEVLVKPELVIRESCAAPQGRTS